jgi:hypothetical protein
VPVPVNLQSERVTSNFRSIVWLHLSLVQHLFNHVNDLSKYLYFSRGICVPGTGMCVGQGSIFNCS